MNINNQLFQKCFTFTKPSLILKVFKNLDAKEKHNNFVYLIKSGLINLKDDIKNVWGWKKNWAARPSDRHFWRDPWI